MPMVLLAPVLGPAAVARDAAPGAADVWAYEQVFVIASLVGVGLGLPVALAGYAMARWLEALGGPIDRGDPPQASVGRSNKPDLVCTDSVHGIARARAVSSSVSNRSDRTRHLATSRTKTRILNFLQNRT